MFFKIAQKGNNGFLKYIVMFIVILAGQILGSFALFAVADPSTLMSGDVAKILGSVKNKNLGILAVSTPFILSFLGFWLLAKPLHKRGLKSFLTGFTNFRWQQFFFAFGVGAVLVTASTLWAYFSAPEDYIVKFNLMQFLLMAAVVLVCISIQACTEELIFRGWLTQGIGLLFESRLFALLIPSILFGALHLSNPEVVEHGVAKMLPLYIIMGLAFGIMTLMNDGAELAMGYHAANNIFLSLLMTSPESVLQTDAIFQLQKAQNIDGEILPVIITEIILIGTFAWKYKWTDWVGKLMGPIRKEQEETIA